MCLPDVVSRPDRIFITKTDKNVRASRVFMFGTDQNARASEKKVSMSLFYNIFRTSVLQKRRTVERKCLEIVVLQCFPDISVTKT